MENFDGQICRMHGKTANELEQILGKEAVNM